jgi:hypothetical protein
MGLFRAKRSNDFQQGRGNEETRKKSRLAGIVPPSRYARLFSPLGARAWRIPFALHKSCKPPKGVSVSSPRPLISRVGTWPRVFFLHPPRHQKSCSGQVFFQISKVMQSILPIVLSKWSLSQARSTALDFFSTSRIQSSFSCFCSLCRMAHGPASNSQFLPIFQINWARFHLGGRSGF